MLCRLQRGLCLENFGPDKCTEHAVDKSKLLSVAKASSFGYVTEYIPVNAVEEGGPVSLGVEAAVPSLPSLSFVQLAV